MGDFEPPEAPARLGNSTLEKQSAKNANPKPSETPNHPEPLNPLNPLNPKPKTLKP